MNLYNKTVLIYVALTVLLSTQELKLIFFKTENLYFGVKSQKIEFLYIWNTELVLMCIAIINMLR